MSCAGWVISYQLLIKPLLYAQAFVFKTFHIFSPVSTSLSHEITIETPLTSKKCRQAKFCLIDAWSKALFFTGETSFSSRFSLTFPSSPRISKNRLNTSHMALNKISSYLSILSKTTLVKTIFLIAKSLS